MPPTMLIDSLNGVRRRVKALGIVMGIGIVVAAAVGLLLFAIVLDYALNLQSWPRVIVLAAAVGGMGYAMARWLVRPALARLTLGDVAGRLEHAFPQFDDRLRSTVDFAQQPGIPGSELMKDRVITEATRLAQQVDLNRAVVMTPVWYATAAGAAALLLVMLLGLTVDPLYRSIALSRLFKPFGGDLWPRRVQIDLVGDVPTRVPVGQKVDVRMRLAKGDRASTKAIIFYQYDGGSIQQQYMTRADDGTYAASLDAMPDLSGGPKAGVMNVWMKAGDDELHLPRPISIVPRLAIQGVEAIVTAPKYANLPPITFNLTNGPAVMVVGSEVTLNVAFNKPLEPAKPLSLEMLNADTKTLDVHWHRAVADLAVGRLNANASTRFHIRATDTDGFQNPGLEEYELIVRPDQLPTVQVENPRRNEERTAVATVPLQAIADDDFGITSLKLVVDRLGDKKHWEIPLADAKGPVDGASWAKADSGADRQRYRANYTWDLAKLQSADLKSGDVLEYCCVVTDNYDLNGSKHPPVPSGKLRITIISQEELTNRLTDELRTVAVQVNDIRNSQNRTKEETQTLSQDTKAKPKLDDADRAAAERLANQQSTAASQAKQVSGKLREMLDRMDENKSQATELKEIAKDVKDQLNTTAEKPMKDASNDLNDAKDPKSPPSQEQRSEKFEDAQKNQQVASDQLQRALDRMGTIGSLQQTIDRIRELLKEQRDVSKKTADATKDNLGKKPEDLKPEDRAKLEAAAKVQAALAKRTEKAVADMQNVAKTMSKSDPASSEAMTSAAKTAQDQQVSSQQSKAAEMTKQNQQGGAQASQKQAELGLEMMLNQLREAERRKLEELAKKLADLQQQVANLIRRQSGHNLDNLGLQGPDRIAKLDAKTLDALLQDSERQKDQLAQPSPLPQLSAGQQQTERNTRDIAKTVEEIPNGSETAAHLTRAASKMERAIVGLRQSKLPDAYDPPQVEALAALQEAKKRVDEEAQKVQDKQDSEKKEAIRAAYQKIKNEQEKLNQETTKLDGAPKQPDGALTRREDAMRLGKLPGDQGGLADRTGKLEEALSAAGGVIYVWANKDIVSTMNGVKDDLGKNVTGVATQAEQARIVEQLDAMIKNLAVKPEEKKFEARNDGGGGGGGNCSPKLPSEVELRLLKDLQKAVNKSTTIIDKQPNKDKPKLLALGNRQGELRRVLDEMLQKSTRGQIKLGPEPDNKDQLPEEATKEQIEDQELDQNLRNGKADEKTEKDMHLVGDRMARSRQRLALNSDPGKVTQIIQERILKDLDQLIDQARKQQQQASAAPPKPGEGQQKPAPKPGEQQPQNANANGKPKPNNGQTPAAQSNPIGGGQANADVTQDIREKMSEWGNTSPRERAALIEGAGETIIEKYKNLTDDYYRSLATKSTERQ